MLACHDEYGVRTALARERCACRTEGEWQMVLFAELYDLRYLLFAVATDDDLRYLAIETGIGAPPEGTKLIGINTVRRKKLSDVG